MWSIGQCAVLYFLLGRYVDAGYNYQYNNQPIIQSENNYAQHVSYTIVSEDYYKNINQNSQPVNHLQYNRPIYDEQLNSQEYPSLNNEATNYNNPQTHSQFGSQATIGNTYYNPEITNSQLQIQNVQPVIKKHIYFHVPPSDLESKTTVAPTKKSYKIIFIKLPSQELRKRVYFQNQLNNLQSKVEEKTIIYVLVKKPEIATSHQVQPKTVHSNPEVFYVKYKHAAKDLGDIAQQINYEFAGPSEAEEDILQRGSINDQIYD